eukprot:Skav220650  [mRNA]  locus=scaffold2038:227247:228311:- [translate_table: standard]
MRQLRISTATAAELQKAYASMMHKHEIEARPKSDGFTVHCEADASSSVASFKFEDGKEVWDEIVGTGDDFGNSDTSLPKSCNRVHIGGYKALINKAQEKASIVYGLFLGTYWKKENGNNLWRGQTLIVSRNVENLEKAAKAKISDRVRVIAFATVDVVQASDMKAETPIPAVPVWLKSFSGEIGGQLLVLQVKIPVNASRPALRAFQFKNLDSSPESVHTVFLTKRLGNSGGQRPKPLSVRCRQ